MTNIDFYAIEAAIQRHRKAVAVANEHNKPVVFDILAATGITSVTVDFDGEGDSGQIESVIACVGATRVELPTTPVTLQHVSWNRDALSNRTEPLREAIETLCYDYLEQTHAGWENNDGAFGSFTFDVDNRTIELEFNGRYTDIATNIYEF